MTLNSISLNFQWISRDFADFGTTTAKRMKIGQYCQRQRSKHVELEQFWHALASRGFVSDSWAFLFLLILKAKERLLPIVSWYLRRRLSPSFNVCAIFHIQSVHVCYPSCKHRLAYNLFSVRNMIISFVRNDGTKAGFCHMCCANSWRRRYIGDTI